MKDACERIQHCKDELPKNDKDPEREKVVAGIKKTLKDVQVDYKEVADVLRRFFGEELSATEATTTAESGKTEPSKAEKK